MANLEEFILNDIESNIARYKRGEITLTTCLHLISVLATM